MKLIKQLLCFKAIIVFQQAPKPSYSVKTKNKSRLEAGQKWASSQKKSDHAISLCIRRAILEIIYPFPVLQYH
jgi:hypothetical protein